MRQGLRPGERIVRAAALLVPWARRDVWLAEWTAELAWAAERGRGAGLAMRLRALASVRDALWIRRRHGRQSVFAGDLRQTLRAIGRRPAYAAAVVVTLGAGIGGATAIFSVVDALVLRPLPYADADRLVEVWRRFESGSAVPDARPAQLATWAGQSEVFAWVEAYTHAGAVVTGLGEPTSETAVQTTAGLLRRLGITPLLGRAFTEEEVAADARVLLLTEPFWRARLGASPGVVGTTVTLDDEPWEVIGVMPRAFRFPHGGRAFVMPLPPGIERGLTGLAALRGDLTVAAAQARIDELAARLDAESPQEVSWSILLNSVSERSMAGRSNRPLWVLSLAVFAVLLIACVNAANLLLVEGATRAREIGIRAALGATRGRLIRLLLTECAVLSLMAAALGVALAMAGVRVLQAIAPATYAIFGPNDFRMDVRVLGFAVLLSVLTGLLFGAGPAIVSSGRRARLTAGERATTGSRSLRRTRAVLAGSELALAMTLLVTASLLIRSFANLMDTDLGVSDTNLYVVMPDPPSFRYTSADAHITFFMDVAERLRAIPGVRAVTVAESLPPDAGFSFGNVLEAEGAPPPQDGQPELMPINAVDDGYFDVLDIPLLAGRTFDGRDASGALPVAVIDVDLARFLWPEAPAAAVVGRRFREEPDAPWLTVVGVVGDVRLLGLPGSNMGEACAGTRCAYEIYRPIRQQARRWSHEIALRTTGPVPGLANHVRVAIWDVDPNVPVRRLGTMEDRLHDALDQPRFLLRIVTAFTVLAVLLAALGVYAVLAYAVSQRTREFGVRIALGARRADVLRDVVAGGARLALVGIAAGALAALAASRLLGALLHGVRPADPVSLAVASVLLAAIALLAALLPARRAMRVSPVDALRSD